MDSCRTKNGKFISMKKKMQLNEIQKSVQNCTKELTEESQNNGEESYNLPGRRIVELDILAQQMFCKYCKKRLHLDQIDSEVQFGFASILNIYCCECGETNGIQTGKMHSGGSRGPKIFDVNTKAAAAMIHTGIGETHITDFFNILNIPPPARKTIKKREREVGQSFEKIAKKSCEDSLNSVINSHNGECSSLVASYDMGWQRRSSGRTYNSMSGHGALFENDSKSIIAYGARITTCRFCEVASRDGRTPNKHDCRRNWSGSSKAMEQSVAVELLTNTRTPTSAVKTIIMDDDTTTLAHLRKEYDPNMVKWSDSNHAKKTLTNMLYKLSNKHKVLTQSKNKVINYVRKCYSYSVVQNQNNPENLKKTLRQIPSHMFGDHDMCGDWCGAKNNSDYRYSSLPRGEPLKDAELYEELKNIFEIFALNAERLAPCGSTKVNESFNNIVASKAPKSRHYSSSESFNCRLDAAAAQKNLGKAYVCRVLQDQGLSPSKIHEHRSLQYSTKNSERNIKMSLKEQKLHRILLKEIRGKKLTALHQTEGTTYKKSVDLNCSLPTNSREDIPDYTEEPALVNYTVCEKNIVYCDIETSGTKSDELTSICQISLHSVDEGEFNVYVLPSSTITPHVSNITNLSVTGNTLCYRGKPVHTVTLRDGLLQMLIFLQGHEEPVTLAAHNAKSCDAPLLTKAISEAKLMREFETCVKGFLDSLPLMKKCYPESKSYSQDRLCKELLGLDYTAHNAVHDARALQLLVTHTLNKFFVDLSQYTMTMKSIDDHNNWKIKQRHNLQSYQPLIATKVISSSMAKKCAGTGLTVEDLRKAVLHPAGVINVLAQNINGIPRVTKNRSVAKKLDNCNILK